MSKGEMALQRNWWILDKKLKEIGLEINKEKSAILIIGGSGKYKT